MKKLLIAYVSQEIRNRQTAAASNGIGSDAPLCKNVIAIHLIVNNYVIRLIFRQNRYISAESVYNNNNEITPIILYKICDSIITPLCSSETMNTRASFQYSICNYTVIPTMYRTSTACPLAIRLTRSNFALRTGRTFFEIVIRNGEIYAENIILVTFALVA